MKRQILLVFLILVSFSCRNEIDYDISGEPMVPVVYAMWSTTDKSHVVYLSGSYAYTVSAIDVNAHVSCIINNQAPVQADSMWTVSSSGNVVAQGYRINASLHAADSVAITVSFPGHVLNASAVVPPELELVVDSTTVYVDPSGRPYRDYNLEVTIKDIPQIPSFYRLYSPVVYVEGWDQWNRELVAWREWPVGLQIDDSDPVFNNATIHFPKELSMDMTFVHSGLNNATHIFTDDSFVDDSHSFMFALHQRLFSVFRSEDYINIDTYPDYLIRSIDWLKYKILFRAASMSENAYLYLLAYNAANGAGRDPFSEPVILPSNIDGGVGFFAIENTSVCELQLEDCVDKL